MSYAFDAPNPKTPRIDHSPFQNRTLKEDSVLTFPLGTLFKINKDAFFNDSKFDFHDQLILALAHAHNDLKSALLFWHVIDEFGPNKKPDENKVCKFVGQSTGINQYCFRLSVGIIYEILTLIEDEDTKRTLSWPSWNEFILTLNQKEKDQWNKILNLASAPKDDKSIEGKVSKLLCAIRSNGGYHYYETKSLKDGYLAHFKGSGPDAEHAYFCEGHTLETSRFFFADAAISTITKEWMGSVDKFNKHFMEYLDSANNAIRAIVIKYLIFRKSTITPADE